MARINATEFKAKCLELMERVAERRETYVITKRGRAVAKLVPPDPLRSTDVFGCMADRTEFVGDIDQPLWTEEEWRGFEAERERRLRAPAGTKRGARRQGRRA